MTENLEILKAKYAALAGPSVGSREPPTPESNQGAKDPDLNMESFLHFFSTARIRTEIVAQTSEKSCGRDGIHMRLLKAFLDTDFLPLLGNLFALCARTGHTPSMWNRSDIHLLSKDPSKRRDANNLRPITIICMFRKVFERLLLQTFDESGWAKLHPAQAGFRGGYSVLTNAAVVHHMLSTQLRTTAVFLDLRSAFDMVSHEKLRQTLAGRGCPSPIRKLISALMFEDVWSQLLVNDATSPPFPRTRGVLQGSPLSPALFNLFIDDLLWVLNATATGLPHCLFYADDGVILTTSIADAQRLLDVAAAWVGQALLDFNVKKCAVISTEGGVLVLQGQTVPAVATYQYLGFPITIRGIDFAAHLTSRLGAAIRRSDFLTLRSDSWGVANRLRVYNRHLAPMFEFGAPLVESWRQSSRQARQEFAAAFASWRKLLAWVNGGSKSCARVTANLLGLTSPQKRFQLLKTQYQLVIQELARDNPLQGIIRKRNAFARTLSHDQTFDAFREGAAPEPDLPTQLQTYLRNARREIIAKEAQRAKLTRIIPLESRRVPGLFLADITLAAPVDAQGLLLSYRRNRFGMRKKCPCGRPYLRTHEICSHLPHPIRLSKAERAEKARMFAHLDPGDAKVTDLDYLLNKGRLDEVITILSAISVKLGEAYRHAQLELAELPQIDLPSEIDVIL